MAKNEKEPFILGSRQFKPTLGLNCYSLTVYLFHKCKKVVVCFPEGEYDCISFV